MSRPLTLYSRNGCHLCEQMLAEVHALYGDTLDVRLVDVDSDAALKARYGLRLPVLAAGEVIVCMGRLDPSALEAYLAAG
ncbi:MAG: glutaredoxin family protein [Gammaproteobacteria bacterium]